MPRGAKRDLAASDQRHFTVEHAHERTVESHPRDKRHPHGEPPTPPIVEPPTIPQNLHVEHPIDTVAEPARPVEEPRTFSGAADLLGGAAHALLAKPAVVARGAWRAATYPVRLGGDLALSLYRRAAERLSIWEAGARERIATRFH